MTVESVHQAEVLRNLLALRALRELCAKCGFTYYNHESNTGVPYPCWTPSGTYSKDKMTNLTPAENETARRNR